MSVRIPWDKYEVALLIEACEEVQKGEMTKSQAVVKVSKTLRDLAVARNYKVDDIFRNENGISMQFSVANGLISDKPSHLTEAKIFKDIAEIYKNDKVAFNSILQEAYRMLNVQSQTVRNDYQQIEFTDNNFNDDYIYSQSIADILLKKYRYGFRTDSAIEYMRFRSYAEEYGITIPSDDSTLKREIIHAGVVIENKLYVISDKLIYDLREIINSIIEKGVQVIFYESLFMQHSEWMSENYIFSVEILVELLRKYFKNIYYNKNFMSIGYKMNENEAISIELRRVWTSSAVMKTNILSELLPYIPDEKIKWHISVNSDFVWSSEGVYLLIDRFIIQDLESEKIKEYVFSVCERDGFVSMHDIPLDSIEEENYEVSTIAIYNAIYNKVLKDKFVLKGKILTKKNVNLDAIVLLKQYCSGKDECTFEELDNYTKEITGEANRKYVFLSLYDTMIRVDKNRYVADKYVDFDIEKIDNLISTFITDKFIAIKSVVTFAMFPLCGQSWNHYLLESYCYRYSNKYSLRCISFNDKNSGIIVEKTSNISYSDMLAEAIARADIKLDRDNACKYLCDSGYIAKSKIVGIDEILNKAIIIRERK